MTTLPRTITNPVLGDKLTFLRTTEETGGEHVLVEIELAPNGGTGLHRHGSLTESFEAIEGELCVHVDGRELRLTPGQRASAPVGAVHRFYSQSSVPICFQVEIRPAGRFEDTLRIAYGLADDGLVNDRHMPKSILHMALLLSMGDTYMAGAPVWLQRAIFTPLAAFARWRGADRALRKYTTSGDAPIRPEENAHAPA